MVSNWTSIGLYAANNTVTSPAVQPVRYSVVHLSKPYIFSVPSGVTARMGVHLKNLAKVKVVNINFSFLLYRTTHFIIEGK